MPAVSVRGTVAIPATRLNSVSILSNARSFLVAIPLVSFRSKGEGPRDRRLDVYRVGSNLSRFRCCSSPVGLGFDRGCSSTVCFLGKAKAMAALGNSFFWPLSRPVASSSRRQRRGQGDLYWSPQPVHLLLCWAGVLLAFFSKDAELAVGLVALLGGWI